MASIKSEISAARFSIEEKKLLEMEAQMFFCHIYLTRANMRVRACVRLREREREREREKD